MAGEERRREEREKTHADVRLRITGLLSREVDGRLVDMSVSGFRAVHSDRDLSVGDLVGFSHPYRAGEAVVVWIRIAQGTIESGFRILQTQA